MQRILFAATAFVLTGTLVAVADDLKPVQPPAAQPKVVQPWGIALSARILQLEEDFETAEAHRDVKKAYVKAAEVAVEAAKVRYDLIAKATAAGGSVTEVTTAKFELEAAKAHLEIRMAELKEAEVKVKFAKKRLDNVKGDGVRPAQPKGGAPAPNGLSTEKTTAELKAKLATLFVEAEQRAEKVNRAGITLAVAQDNLTKLREAAKVRRLQPGTLEKAEAFLAEAETQFTKRSAERKALDVEIDALRKKLKEPGK
jgi:hypothetical protein